MMAAVGEASCSGFRGARHEGVMDPIERAVRVPQIEIIVRRRASRRVLGIARHWQPALRMYIRPLTTSRAHTVRLLPPRLAGGMGGSVGARSSSLESEGSAGCCGVSVRGPRWSTSAAATRRIRRPRLNQEGSACRAASRIGLARRANALMPDWPEPRCGAQGYEIEAPAMSLDAAKRPPP
jgi:hypothetical protein